MSVQFSYVALHVLLGCPNSKHLLSCVERFGTSIALNRHSQKWLIVGNLDL